ncbi:hypothetical protein F5880DRAFT_1510972 [Lentinula raphanica]|nr:hypothetical protein F5880DRAFT_1510972 [Lentinula raphanica]
MGNHSGQREIATDNEKLQAYNRKLQRTTGNRNRQWGIATDNRKSVTGGVASSRQLGLGLGQSGGFLDIIPSIAGNQLLSPLGVAGPAQFLTTLGSLTPWMVIKSQWTKGITMDKGNRNEQ